MVNHGYNVGDQLINTGTGKVQEVTRVDAADGTVYLSSPQGPSPRDHDELSKCWKLHKKAEELSVPTCPFCGGDAAIALTFGYVKRVACFECGAEGPNKRTEREAIVAWSTRI